jgi:hypothetical protein
MKIKYSIEPRILNIPDEYLEGATDAELLEICQEAIIQDFSETMKWHKLNTEE